MDEAELTAEVDGKPADRDFGDVPPTSFRAGLWRLADPKISLASMASIFLGTCAAAAAGRIDVPWLLVTIAAIFAIEVAKNASGEIFHTYSVFARGDEILCTAYMYIDLLPKGRDEAHLEDPTSWWRHHDKYFEFGNAEERKSKLNCCS